jgi:hypothetical protein
MQKEILAEEIIRDLKRYRPRNEIIMELCERYKLGWMEAEGIIAEIEANAKRDIDRSRKGMYVAFGVIMAVLGFAGAIATIAATLGGWVIIMFRVIPYAGNILLLLVTIGVAVGGVMGTIQSMKD